MDTFPLTILPQGARRAPVWLDPAGRITTDGKPLFPLGLFLPADDVTMLDLLRETGLNCVANSGPMAETTVGAGNYLDAAEQRGIRVLFGFDRCKDASDLSFTDPYITPFKAVEALRFHPALLAWRSRSELDYDTRGMVQWRYKALREGDPGHPVVESVADPTGRAMPTAGDIELAIVPMQDDWRSRPTEPAERASRGVQAVYWQMGRACVADRAVPRWALLCFGGRVPGSFGVCPPSWEEARSPLLAAIACGVRGVVLDCVPKGLESTEALRETLGQVAALVQALGPALIADDAAPDGAFTCDDQSVAGVTRQVEGARQAFVVNGIAQQITARFRVRAPDGEVWAGFPDEQQIHIPVADGGFEDTLPPHGVRMYTVRDP